MRSFSADQNNILDCPIYMRVHPLLSVYISVTWSLLAMNRLHANRNESMSRLCATSKWTAQIAKHVKMTLYVLTRPCPRQTWKGPKLSTPTDVKGGLSGKMRVSGKSPSSVGKEAPVDGSSYLSAELEQLQKRAMRIIFPFVPYSDALHQANLETLSRRRQSITTKLFDSITCNSDHKLPELLKPRSNCESHLRRKRNFNVPLAKRKRLKNTFM